MALTPGTRVGPYEIIAALGAGGMGEVYRATDSNLKRQVAIKVLPGIVAADPERLARFQREAEVLALLNHPNIAQIHGLETSGGTLAIVMELVEGRTLADAIAQGAIPIADALPIATQIAEALEAAHEQGIIHRDLKPANVKVRPDGTVKVLDFGLAKAMDASGASSADAMSSPTMHATQAGIILGTAAYMSPEQARGGVVDRRADIWAFGCVLYEMLAGKSVFARESVTDTLATITRDEPDWTALPAGIPDRVRRLLARCLHRDVKLRLQSIGEARIALDAPDEPRDPAVPVVGAPSPRPAQSRALAWGAALLVPMAAAAAAWLLARASLPSPVVTRLSIALPFPLSPQYETGNVALSPDGSTLAYVGISNGTTSLYVRAMNQFDVKALAGTDGAQDPVFSPDGTWIAFVADRKVKKVPVLGGPSTVLDDRNPDSFGLDWPAAESIFFSPGFTLGVARLSASGGDAQRVLIPDPGKKESGYLWPRLLPGGSDMLFVINPDSHASFDEGQLAVETLGKEGSREVLDAQGSFPRYTSSGHLVFVSGGSLRAAPFDLQRRKITGSAVPVVEGIAVTPHTGAAQAAISASGTLVYAPVGDQTPRSTLVVVDVSGHAQPVSDSVSHFLGEMSVSSDGQRVALRSAKANDDIHVFDIPRGTLTRLTYEGGDEQSPVWTPDGKRLAYASQHGGTPTMYWKTADGNGTPEQILTPQHSQRPSSFSPDGKLLAYTEIHPQSGLDMWTVRLDGPSPRQPDVFLQTPFDESLPLFSPDGRWIAYRSNESGRMEIYVARFPGAAVKRQISTDGGDQPLWAPDGKRLFYVNGTRIMSVDLRNDDSGLQPARPRALYEKAFSMASVDSGMWGHTWAVFPDGKRFLFVENPARPEVRELRVVINWFEELKARVPATK